MNHKFTKIMILITVMILDILSGAEIDLFIPSFPEIKNHFNISNIWLEALISVNFLGYCLSLFFVEGLADRYGRKPIILLGLAIFIIGSIFCTNAISYNFLLLGRFLQGIGIAAPATLCFLIIADLYSLKKQQYFMGVLNGLMNVAVAGAPVLGSYITMKFNWNGNFTALLFFGILVTIMTMVFIPPSKFPEIREPISLSGYIPLFKSKILMLLITNTVFMFAPYWIFLGMSPILYMKDLGVSLKAYGYYQGAWALVYALGSIFFGLIINKFPVKRMLNISAYACLLGFGIILLVASLDIKDPLIITLSFMVFNIGSIIPGVIVYPLTLNFIPSAKGRISALLRAGILVTTIIGLEFAGYCYQGSFKNLGILLSSFVLVGVITLFYLIKNPEVNKFFEVKT